MDQQIKITVLDSGFILEYGTYKQAFKERAEVLTEVARLLCAWTMNSFAVEDSKLLLKEALESLRD